MGTQEALRSECSAKVKKMSKGELIGWFEPLPQRKWMRWDLGQREPTLARRHTEVERTFHISDFLAREKQRIRWQAEWQTPTFVAERYVQSYPMVPSGKQT